MNTLQFIVPGRPVPAVRTTQRTKHIDPQYHRYAAYKDWVGFTAKREMKKQGFIFAEAITKIEFKAMATLATKHRIDVDNILKSVMDSLNGIVWHDDSQVMSAYISKEFVTNKDDEKVIIYINTL